MILSQLAWMMDMYPLAPFFIAHAIATSACASMDSIVVVELPYCYTITTKFYVHSVDA